MDRDDSGARRRVTWADNAMLTQALIASLSLRPNPYPGVSHMLTSRIREKDYSEILRAGGLDCLWIVGRGNRVGRQ